MGTTAKFRNSFKLYFGLLNLNNYFIIGKDGYNVVLDM